MVAVVGFEADGPALVGVRLIGLGGPLELGLLRADRIEPRALRKAAARADGDVARVVVAHLDVEAHDGVAFEVVGATGAGAEEDRRRVGRGGDVDLHVALVDHVAPVEELDRELLHADVARQGRVAEDAAVARAADVHRGVEPGQVRGDAPGVRRAGARGGEGHDEGVEDRDLLGGDGVDGPAAPTGD